MNSSAPPRLLLLETSGRVGQVGLAVGSELVGVRLLDEARRHARDLAPALVELLKENGWRSRDLNAVVVSRGPGSYTGLRVGIMSAKTLAYATGCALITVDTFAVIAAQAIQEDGRLDVIADAQQEKIYVQPFARTTTGWSAVADLTIQPFAQWLEGRQPGSRVTGPGLQRWMGQLSDSCDPLDAACWEPQIASLLRLGLARFQAGVRDDLWTLEPLYLRPSSAEEQWAAKKAP